MPWVKIDDGFFDNLTNRQLGPAGRDLFIAGLAFCAKGLTDGVIPKADLPLLLAQAQAKPATVRKLVEVGRWTEDGDDYRVDGYLEYQPSKARVLAERKNAKRSRDLHSDPALVATIRRRDGDRCRYCGRSVSWKDRRGPLGATYDHVDPAGGNSPENVVVACRGCNSRKCDRPLAAAGMTLLPEPGSDLDRSQIGIPNKSSPRPVPTRPPTYLHPVGSPGTPTPDEPQDGHRPTIVDTPPAPRISDEARALERTGIAEAKQALHRKSETG